MKKILQIAEVVWIVSVLLIGCATQPPKTISVPVEITKEQLILPAVSPAEQYPFDWYVITPDNSQDKLEAIAKASGAPVAIAVTPDGYNNLNLSIAELRKYIEQLQAVVEAYRQYYLKDK